MKTRKNNMDELDASRVIALWMDTNLANDEVASLLACSFSKVRTTAKKLGLPLARMGCNTGRRPKDPTESEIAARCLEIQARWTDEERNERAGVTPRILTFMEPR